MIPLHQIQLEAPCQASWDDMQGDAQVRYCTHCCKNVYNLSEMTRAEASRIVSASSARPCVRFARRADGTVLTRTPRPVLLRHLALLTGVLAAFGNSLVAPRQAPAAKPAKRTVSAGKIKSKPTVLGRLSVPPFLTGMIAPPAPRPPVPARPDKSGK